MEMDTDLETDARTDIPKSTESFISIKNIYILWGLRFIFIRNGVIDISALHTLMKGIKILFEIAENVYLFRHIFVFSRDFEARLTQFEKEHRTPTYIGYNTK